MKTLWSIKKSAYVIYVWSLRKVADQLNIDVGNRLTTGSRKIKFLIRGPLPEDSKFPEGFRDFDICHHFLQTSDQIQSRLRKRDSKGKAKVTSTYTHTIRKMVSEQVIETKRSLNNREYEALVIQKSSNHLPVHKTRRYFLFNSQYFHLDIYTYGNTGCGVFKRGVQN